MGSRLRVWIVAIATAVLITALAPIAFGVSRGAQPPILVVISPPSGLGLPAGQHVGVRYRLTGETPAILELAADGVTLVADGVQPGQQVTHAWTPAGPGPHQVLVRALGLNGTVLGSTRLTIIGLPAGSRVRVP